jgi:hypothetical protein
MVEEIGMAVVDALEVAGYKESTIDQYRKSIRVLAVLAQRQGGVYTLGFRAEFASRMMMMMSARTGRFSAQRRFDCGRLEAMNAATSGSSQSYIEWLTDEKLEWLYTLA